jgi:branched-chain amino acid transport system permease protein
MIFRENGQFKSTYRSDLQMLPILQDRVFMAALVVFAFAVVPLLASDYLYLSILIPFLILTLAAIGLNLLVGYCGQISLGHAAFMAVGAYAAYNLVLRLPALNFLVVLVLAGLFAAAAGMIFGIPSLRIKGLYLAVATLAAQFFLDWVFARVKWFTDYSHSGSVSVAPVELFGWRIDTAAER